MQDLKKFLSAKWIDLVMANYEVDARVLAPLVPAGTEIDLYDGNCFVSLVAFMFLDTRVSDFLVPFHVNFEEVNLRFYVKRQDGEQLRRGVVFVKEIVPRTAIALVARRLYGEPYERWSMSNFRDRTIVRYAWEKGGVSNSVSIERGELGDVPAAGSHGEFIIEHYWGYTKRGNNRTDEYRVEHPKWRLFSADSANIDVDFERTYGERFAFLNNAEPFSVLLAEGSEIGVYRGRKLTI